MLFKLVLIIQFLQKMPTTHVAKYPIVDPEPNMTKAILNYNATDYMTIGVFTIAGYAVGWFGGKNDR